MSKELIENLLQALDVSPENTPLRMQVASLMMQEQRYPDAAQQYQLVLDRSYGNIEAKAGLARAFYYQHKYSAAIVIYEQLEHEISTADQVYFIKSLLKENSVSQASELYQQLLILNPGYRDSYIDEQLRISAMPAVNFDEEIEVGHTSRFMEKPSIKFDAVGGMKKVKEEIAMKIIKPLQNPVLYKAFGKKAGGGILLYGPPGCGKTFIAKATAGEIDAKFINIGLHDILDMWIGNSEKNLHEIFETARANTPCVIFFDEVDAMGASRSDLKQSAMRHVINQFLAELDGVQSNNEGVLVLAATNAPWSVDAAFRRPGRFDRVIFVAPPDEEARRDILQSILKDKPSIEIDIKKIAASTNNYSGADLKAIVDIASEEKLNESLAAGAIQPITTKDLVQAIRQHKATTLEWFASARNYALYSNESGLYDDILRYLKIKK